MSHIATRVSNAIRHQATQAGRAISTKAQSLTRRVRNARDTVRRAYSQNANQWDQDKFLEPAADGFIMTNHSYVPESRFEPKVRVEEKQVTRWDVKGQSKKARDANGTNADRMLVKQHSMNMEISASPSTPQLKGSAEGMTKKKAFDMAETAAWDLASGPADLKALSAIHAQLTDGGWLDDLPQFEVESLAALAANGDAATYAIHMGGLLSEL